MYGKITVEDLLKLNSPSIIDVRETYEYEMGYIPSAVNIPVRIILNDYKNCLKKDQRYYIYCQTSMRSTRVCEFLAELGYDIYLVDGGYKAWSLMKNNK